MFFVSGIIYPGIGGVGDVDNRYYVTDAMWATEPYKKFVHLITYEKIENKYSENGSCTAQYISPNLILSVGHCVEVDGAYVFQNYKNEKFPAMLVETPYDGKKLLGIDDWAVFLVTDPAYYSDTYFTPVVPTQNTNVINAGWGWVKILNKEQLDKIRQILSNKAEVEKNKGKLVEYINKNFSDGKYKDYWDCVNNRPNCWIKYKCNEDCYDNKYFKCRDAGKSQDICYDEAWAKCCTPGHYSATCEKECENYDILRDRQNRLKASKCQILYKGPSSKFPKVLDTTCDTWGGNSGGGYVSDNIRLYGIVSYGTSEEKENVFVNANNADHMTSALQFRDRIKELIKTYDSKNSVVANISKIPKNNFDKIFSRFKPQTSGGSNMKLFSDNRLKKMEQEIEQSDTQTMEFLQNNDVSAWSDDQLKGFINKIVERQVKSERLEELKRTYEEAQANEQSFANRALTAASVAAAGVGGMELAIGLAEQRADKAAAADMDAYIATMRCKYGNNQVKAGSAEIELPGGNDETMTKLRNEYFALAADLKERKTALGMTPGIESEEILDKSTMGLYDNENIGISDGAYSSLYRAKMLNSEKDQTQIKEAQESSQNRVNIGGTATGAGVIGGVAGDMMINGKNKDKK